MDPDETLRKLRSAVTELYQEADPDNPLVNEVFEHFDDLDTWLSKGGFLPLHWKNGRTPS